MINRCRFVAAQGGAGDQEDEGGRGAEGHPQGEEPAAAGGGS